jgi:di/tricarboxylate transporter
MINLTVTSLLVLILFSCYGILLASEAPEPFADPVVHLLMRGAIIADAFRKNGIDRNWSSIWSHSLPTPDRERFCRYPHVYGTETSGTENP